MLEHETKHHAQFIEYYAKPLMNAIDNLNASYHYEYCSLAFDASEISERAENDAVVAHESRYNIVLVLIESWDDYNAAANELDASDYALIDSAMPTNLSIRD